MPGSIDNTMAIVALCQALVAKLTRLNNVGLWTPLLSNHFIEENKWHAMRFGLDAEVIDYAQVRRLGMRESISELLDFVDDVVEDLGSRTETNYLRAVLEDQHGTGADQQIAIYRETGNIDDVIKFLMRETMKGIPTEDVDVVRAM